MKVVIFGGTSGIAQGVAQALCDEALELVLVARDQPKARLVADDLLARGAKRVEIVIADLTDTRRFADLLRSATEALGGFDLALLAFGMLSDQEQCAINAEAAASELQVNFNAPIALLVQLSSYFEQRGTGTIAVIGSVAGDRGRASNYTYGAAKAGLAVYVEGLRYRLAPKGIKVILIKPGFVVTPMLPLKARESALAISAAAAGRMIVASIRANRSPAYIPWFWRPIMAGLCLLPGKIFGKMKI